MVSSWLTLIRPARWCATLAYIALLWVAGLTHSTTAWAASPDGLLEEDSAAPARLGKQVRVVRDVPYGSDRKLRFDVYTQGKPQNAPVIFMVHGGGWRTGDKSAASVVQQKVARWVPRGWVLISVNHRLLPHADPLEQAWDVAQALSTAQAKAASWGGDRQKFILMGHSAGAHLVALLNASPIIAIGRGATPWLGAISLDSAALDVPAVMDAPHPRLYDRAFGPDPGFWQSVSPWHQISKSSPPLLAVCSTRRSDACPQAQSYADKAHGMGLRVRVLPQDLSHRDINAKLGEPGAYTTAVEQFMSSLSTELASR